MTPARMSIVLITDRYLTIRRVLGQLAGQTAADVLEIVVVMPAGALTDAERASLDTFAAVKFVEIPSIHPMPAARAAGIRAATSDIVFLGETHSFPHPEFAERLLAAHEGEWDAVVPGFGNANPDSDLSWASFLMDYGTWSDTLPSGQVLHGPTWNNAYKRSFLAKADDRLELAMEHGDELARLFVSLNGRALFEPRARLDHANVAQFRSWIDQRYLAGLLVANARRRRWGIGKRLVYVAASPLIPAVIMYRLRKPVMQLAASGRLSARGIGVLMLGTVVRTFGEVSGYVKGAAPGAQLRMDEYELRKLDFTSLEM